jgi:bifunctional non-homologous end joining protein LigD
VFDALVLGQRDLRKLPVLERKRLLRAAIDFSGRIHITPHKSRHGERYLKDACRRGWEGLIAKRADAPYQSGRNKDWLKLKCTASQELVIGGFTDPEGSRTGFGALLVGHYDDAGALHYAGKVGTGFGAATLAELSRELRRLALPSSPFEVGDPPTRRVHWVKPELVAEISFTEWTRDGRLRHPVFQGLRTDKAARDIVRERKPSGV